MLSQEGKWLLEEKYDGKKSAAFFADLKRLEVGEPLAYIIGHIPFLGCRIVLDSHPLIPRSETEYWVEKAITEVKKVSNPHVLDLCAGSGAIGVAVAIQVSGSAVDLAEIDPIHISTIKKNLEINNVAGKVIESDLFTNITGKYDFILSNPPYIDPVLDRTEASVKNYEPHLALYADNKGLELIELLITEAPSYLNPGGQLWFEHEPEQSEAIKHLANDAGFAGVVNHSDQYGIQRYSVLKLL